MHVHTHNIHTHLHTCAHTYHAGRCFWYSNGIQMYVITGTKFNTADDVLVNSPGTLLVPVTCKNYLR